MLQKIVHYFIPSPTIGNVEYLRRQRLIIYAIVVTMIFTLFYVITSITVGYWHGIIMMLSSWLVYLGLLFLMKFGLNIFVAANLFSSIGALSIVGCIYFSGGFESPVLPWLASTPIVLLLIAGKKSGFVWAIICVLIVVAFGALHYSGFKFPKTYDHSYETYFELTCHFGLVLIIFFISFVFETLRVNALNQVLEQKNILQIAHDNLKATQAQLIQSEKMASLGELTAGIAHEIQNPLNFVNNFSQLNCELIDELKNVIEVKNKEEAVELANELKQNLEKITQHGKRADNIVKGMIQHSSSSIGNLELTDINRLTQDYLRLAYYSIFSKDKDFKLNLTTNFDENVGCIILIPQHIGKAILNIINNAYYTVKEKSNQNIANYDPTVEVITKREGDKVLICIKDNGNGIPNTIKEKIFQPFFTTKPAGQATGLGLSLAFDIVKAHGGELKVETFEGEGTAFTIQLPFTYNMN